MTQTPRITKVRLEATQCHKSIPGNGAKNLLGFPVSARFIVVLHTSVVLRDGLCSLVIVSHTTSMNFEANQ